MSAMLRALRCYVYASLGAWAGLVIAAVIYARLHPDWHWIYSAALPAFLLESVFYLGSVFESSRQWFATRVPRTLQGLVLWLSALLPYLIWSIGSGTFNTNAFLILASLTGVLSFWYVLTPERPTYDIGFLALAAVPMILRTFVRLYVSPDPHFAASMLGHLMWFRLAMAALLVLRGWDPGPFGFWPKRSEWRTGFVWFVISIVPVAGVSVSIGDTRFEPHAYVWWRLIELATGTFFAFLWVVAMGEELFFRGVIERALLRAQQPAAVAIAVSALLFGGVHLWTHPFPNWRRALVAAILGVACGLAYWRSGSVRAPMVTHALTITAWRLFFKNV